MEKMNRPLTPFMNKKTNVNNNIYQVTSYFKHAERLAMMVTVNGIGTPLEVYM